MAFSTTTAHVEKPVSQPSGQPSNEMSDVLMSAILLSMYGAQMSKKTVRKLKRKFFFTSLKLKAKSLFSPRATASDRTIIYIILGVALLALLLINPVLVLALAVVVLILILAGVI